MAITYYKRLLETGDYRLLETGDYRVLESPSIIDVSITAKAAISKNTSKNLTSKGNIKKTIGGVDIADYNNEANLYDDFYLGGGADSSGWGQSFTGNGEILKNAKFYLKKYGNPTGNATVKIFAHTGTFGIDGKPIGSALAISSLVLDVSSVPTSYTLINFDFSGVNRITLENETKYVLTIEYNSGIFPTDYIGVGMSNDNSHPGNPSYTTDNLNWTGIDLNYDLIFYVYTDGITDLNAKALIQKQTTNQITTKTNIKKLSVERSISTKATIHKIFSTELVINNSAGNGYSNIASVNWNGQGQSFLIGTDKLHLARIRHIGQWQWGYGPPTTPTRLHCAVFTADINHLPVDLVATSYLSYETTDIEKADSGHSPNYTTFDFWFTKGIELDPATQYVYFIVVEDPITDTILDGLTSSLNPYPNGRLIRVDNESNITSNIGYDCWFEIYEYTENIQTLSAKGFIDAHKRYWVGGSGYWNGIDDSHWSYTSGGTNNAPIPTLNDDIYFDENSGLIAESLIHPPGMVGGDCKNFTSTTGTGFQIDSEGDIHIYGNIVLETNLIFPEGNAPAFYLYGSGNQTIITNGASIYQFIVMCEGIYTLLDNLILTGGLWGYSGTFDANDNNIISSNIYLAGVIWDSINIYMGSGTWELTSDSQPPWFVFGDYGNNIFCETSTIKITSNSANEKNFSGGNLTYNKVWFATTGIGEITISGNNTFNELKIEPAQTVLFQTERIQTINTFDCIGTIGNLITFGSITPDTQFTLSKSDGIVNCDYLDISDSNATGGADWYAGEHSINNGNNTGWIWTISQNLTAKANIYPNIITSSTSISTKSRININSEKIITSKSRIEKLNIKTFISKSRIEINTNQTISSKSRITITNNQSLISKARIQKSNNQNLESKTRISINSEKTILTKARIQILSSQNISTKGRIVQTFSKSISTKARIEQFNLITITSKARISINSNSFILAKSNIENNISQNITALTRIEVISTKIISAKTRITQIQTNLLESKANILNTQEQTLLTKARITGILGQFIETKASIQKETEQSIIALISIQKENDQSIYSKGRIEFLINQEINAKTRIQINLNQIITSRGRITFTQNQLVNALARITQSKTELITTKADISKLTTQTILVKGNIFINQLETVNSKGRIEKEITKNILAKTRINRLENQIIIAKAEIKKSISQTLIAKAKIEGQIVYRIEAKACIVANKISEIEANARIEKITSQIINVKGNINFSTTQSINSKTNILINETRIIESKAKIETNNIQIIESKANILKNNSQVINSKTRISLISEKTINAKTNISNYGVQILSAKANIKKNIICTLTAKSKIQIINIESISCKANIVVSKNQNINVKGNIKLNTSRLINVKAKIEINTLNILIVKASIKNLINQTLLAKAKLQTVKVTEIINQYREAEIAVDITYVKEIVKEVVYNKIKVKEIKDNFVKVKEIDYNKVDIINIVEPKIQKIKWFIVKGFITN